MLGGRACHRGARRRARDRRRCAGDVSSRPAGPGDGGPGHSLRGRRGHERRPPGRRARGSGRGALQEPLLLGEHAPLLGQLPFAPRDLLFPQPQRRLLLQQLVHLAERRPRARIALVLRVVRPLPGAPLRGVGPRPVGVASRLAAMHGCALRPAGRRRGGLRGRAPRRGRGLGLRRQRPRGGRGPGRGGKNTGALEFRHHLVEQRCVDFTPLLAVAEDERGVGDDVDEARHAAAALVDQLGGRRRGNSSGAPIDARASRWLM